MTQRTVLEHLAHNIGGERSRRRTALVVQGGGMRGVYSMGALTALEDHGLRRSFDLIIGSSAGAINAAYFLTGQAHGAVDVYVEYLSNRHFVNPWRINKIVDIDYLVDHALRKCLPIDVTALRESASELQIVLTDADTAGARVVSNRDPDFDFYEIVRATAALPALYNRRIPLGDRYYVDGGTADSVPVVRAAEWGAKEVLAVLTRSSGYRRLGHGPVYQTIASLMARGQSKAIRSRLGRADVPFNDAMDLLEGKSKRDGLTCWSVWPSDKEELVSRTTFDKIRLRECAAMGRRDMEAVLATAYNQTLSSS